MKVEFHQYTYGVGVVVEAQSTDNLEEVKAFLAEACEIAKKLPGHGGEKKDRVTRKGTEDPPKESGERTERTEAQKAATAKWLASMASKNTIRNLKQ